MDSLTSEEVEETEENTETQDYGNSPEVRYLKEIGRFPLLTKDEEVELAMRIENGDEEARKRLIEANLRLVIFTIKKKFSKARYSFLDMVQAGNLGIYRATKKFKHEKGYRFSTYATWWIEHAIRRDIEDNSRVVRIPVHVQSFKVKFNKTTGKLGTKLGREPTFKEIADELKITGKRLGELLQRANIKIVFTGDYPDERYLFSGDIKEDELPGEEEEEGNRILEEAIEKLLDPREQFIIRKRFGFGCKPMTLKEVGDCFGFSSERVGQIQERALKKLAEDGRIQELR